MREKLCVFPPFPENGAGRETNTSFGGRRDLGGISFIGRNAASLPALPPFPKK